MTSVSVFNLAYYESLEEGCLEVCFITSVSKSGEMFQKVRLLSLIFNYLASFKKYYLSTVLSSEI